MLDKPSFTIGMEEEYLLVDLETRNLAVEPPADLLQRCQDAMPGQVTPEFLQSQIEVGTKVCKTAREAGEELSHLRRTLASVAGEFGLAPIAASTHPFAAWKEQKHTAKERYDGLANELGGAVARLMICGMHVHVGIEDEDLRIDLLNQAAYFLPHLLALSGSSPFWQGSDMGMASYRLNVFDTLPRTGLPDTFESFAQYRRLVSQLVEPGLIEDATKIWWDARPSDRYPTVEMRITDICTRLEDAVAIAATYQCLLSMLFRLRQRNQRWRIYPRSLIQENRWRAQRYGVEGLMVDFGRSKLVPVRDLMEEILELIADDAEEFGCQAEVAHILTICERGTSSTIQRKAFEIAKAEGASDEEALFAVVDTLIAESVPK